MKTIKPGTLPAHEMAARRFRANVSFAPKPVPPPPPPWKPNFQTKFDPWREVTGGNEKPVCGTGLE